MPAPPITTDGIPDKTVKRLFYTGLFTVLMQAGLVSVLIFLFLLSSFCARAEPIFQYKSRITLHALKPVEIFASNSEAYSVDEGAFTASISGSGEVTGSALSESDLDQLYTGLTFKRWTNSTDSDIDPANDWLWLLAWPVEEQHNCQKVTITVSGLSGAANSFSHIDDASSYLAVSILDTQPTCSQETFNGTVHMVCKGRTQLQFDLSEAKRSGTYQGTLTVTVEYL